MKWLIFFSSLLLLSGCRLEGNVKKVFLRSYVREYYKPAGITLSARPDGNGMKFYFGFGKYVCRYSDEGDKKAVYDALCEKNGDMTFNRTVWVGSPHPIILYMSTTFVSVDVVSNADFDEQHPAGTSLADIIMLDSTTAKPYIDSGYVEYEYDKEHRYPYYFIHKMLSEVIPYDLILLGDGRGIADGNFVFESLPTMSKEHTFTITFTDDEGSKMSSSIEMTFE
jgi:hypothetical protein